MNKLNNLKTRFKSMKNITEDETPLKIDINEITKDKTKELD